MALLPLTRRTKNATAELPAGGVSTLPEIGVLSADSSTMFAVGVQFTRAIVPSPVARSVTRRRFTAWVTVTVTGCGWSVAVGVSVGISVGMIPDWPSPWVGVAVDVAASGWVAVAVAVEVGVAVAVVVDVVVAVGVSVDVGVGVGVSNADAQFAVVEKQTARPLVRTACEELNWR